MKNDDNYSINEVIKAPRSSDCEKVEVVTILIDSKKVREVLDVINELAPLESFSLNHFKRIKGNCRDKQAEKSTLQILLCRKSDFEGLNPSLISLLSTFQYQSALLCAWEPQCRIEFDNWKNLWPMHYHPSQSERDRDAGFSMQEIELIEKYLDRLNLEKKTGGFIVNAASNKIIISSNEYSRLVFKRSEDFNNPIKTPTILCIDGVAAMLRGEIEDTNKSLPNNHYLCSGLDLYLTEEPDLLSAMALVHSRIRRVFFRSLKTDPGNPGALLTAYHLHLLPSLNHHYRVFYVDKK